MELTLKTISRRTKWGILLLGFILSFSMMGLLAWGHIPYNINLIDWLIVVIVACAVVTIVHEGLHGLFFKIFGGDVKFGVAKSSLGPTPYATSLTYLPRSRFQLVALAPQLLTIACLIGLLTSPPPMVAVGLIIVAAGNLGGGCFDLYTAKWLNRFPREYKVLDIKDGVKVIA